VSQPYGPLNNGLKIPLVGLGTFKSSDEVMDEAVGAALRYGIRHIDCVSLQSPPFPLPRFEPPPPPPSPSPRSQLHQCGEVSLVVLCCCSIASCSLWLLHLKHLYHATSVSLSRHCKPFAQASLCRVLQVSNPLQPH